MISVCVTTHNGERYIKTQIDSILSQLSSEDEVIVSDDGSTDGTLEVLNRMKDSRIRVFNYEQKGKSKHSHWYVTKNFQNALVHARGDVIFLSDQDDYWVSSKVETCLYELQNCDLVIHDMKIVDDNLVEQGKCMFNNGFRFNNFLMREGAYFGCAMAFNRNILDAALPFPKKLMVHDIWIGLLAEAIGSVKFINKPLILYRVRSDSISHAVKNSIWYKFYYRFYTLINLVVRIIKVKLSR